MHTWRPWDSFVKSVLAALFTQVPGMELRKPGYRANAFTCRVTGLSWAVLMPALYVIRMYSYTSNKLIQNSHRAFLVCHSHRSLCSKKHFAFLFTDFFLNPFSYIMKCWIASEAILTMNFCLFYFYFNAVISSNRPVLTVLGYLK